MYPYTYIDNNGQVLLIDLVLRTKYSRKVKKLLYRFRNLTKTIVLELYRLIIINILPRVRHYSVIEECPDLWK